MALEDRISQDLKTAMLEGQQQRVMTLRGLKSSLLYAKVAAKKSRDEALPDAEVLELLSRESKKRQESADLYQKGNSPEKAGAELQEKAIIDAYLPELLSDEELTQLIDTAIEEMGPVEISQMGQLIGKVKQQAGAAADGAAIARIVKERLSE